MAVEILLDTVNGAFSLSADEAREGWSLHGPYYGLQPIDHVVQGSAPDHHLVAGGRVWEGAR